MCVYLRVHMHVHRVIDTLTQTLSRLPRCQQVPTLLAVMVAVWNLYDVELWYTLVSAERVAEQTMVMPEWEGGVCACVTVCVCV